MTALSFDYLYNGSSLNSLLAELLPSELRDPPLDDIDCNGFLSRDDLADLVGLLEGELSTACFPRLRLLDLGCGSGGLARYLSSRFGCRVTGVDVSPQAITRAHAAGVTALIDLRTADFASTGLPSGSVAAAVSVDSLYLAVDRRSALVEVRRVLAPGGILVFTSYTSAVTMDECRPESWRSVSTSVGLEVETCRDVTASWRRVMWLKHQARWNARDKVIELLGRRAKSELAVSAAMLGIHEPSFLDRTKRYELRLRRPE